MQAFALAIIQQIWSMRQNENDHTDLKVWKKDDHEGKLIKSSFIRHSNLLPLWMNE